MTFIVQMWQYRSCLAILRSADQSVWPPCLGSPHVPKHVHAVYTFTWRHDQPCVSTTFLLPRVLDTRICFASVSVDTHVSFASVARSRHSLASPHSFPSTSFTFPLVLAQCSLGSSTLSALWSHCIMYFVPTCLSSISRSLYCT